jgi:mannose-1-phosphate guanylyltransferase
VQSGDYIGVSALGPTTIAGLPERGCLFGDVALPRLARGGKVWTVPSAAPWTDLGDLAQYVAANFDWLARHSGSSWIADTARVAASISLERCLIGAGARVGGSGALSQVIAWPGAPVTAPLCRAVVLGSGQVVPFDSAEN